MPRDQYLVFLSKLGPKSLQDWMQSLALQRVLITFSAWEHGQDLMLPSKESTSLCIFEPCLLHAGGRDRSPPVAARSVDLSKTIAGGALSPADQAPPPSSSPGPFGSASMTPLAFGAPTPGSSPQTPRAGPFGWPLPAPLAFGAPTPGPSPQTPAAGPFGLPTTAPLSFGAPTPSSAPSTPAAPSSSTPPGLFTSHPSVSRSGVSTPGPFGQLAVAQSPVFGLSTIAAAPVASNGGSGPFGAKTGEAIRVTAALTVQLCNVQHLADIFC